MGVQAENFRAVFRGLGSEGVQAVIAVGDDAARPVLVESVDHQRTRAPCKCPFNFVGCISQAGHGKVIWDKLRFQGAHKNGKRRCDHVRSGLRVQVQTHARRGRCVSFHNFPFRGISRRDHGPAAGRTVGRAGAVLALHPRETR